MIPSIVMISNIICNIITILYEIDTIKYDILSIIGTICTQKKEKKKKCMYYRITPTYVKVNFIFLDNRLKYS
jgi:hypothetical protein